MPAAVLLLLAGATGQVPVAPDDRAQRAVALVRDFCLVAEYMPEKTARLAQAGWLEQASTASLNIPGSGGLRVFASDDAPRMVLSLTHAANDDRQVVSCMVDGKDLDAASLVKAAYRSFRPVFGEPVQEGATITWPLPELRRWITIAPSRVLNNAVPERAFMIHVRLIPVSETESQN